MQQKLIDERVQPVGPAEEHLTVTTDDSGQLATIDLTYFQAGEGSGPESLIASSFTTLPWRVMKEIADVVQAREKNPAGA